LGALRFRSRGSHLRSAETTWGGRRLAFRSLGFVA
jgi:hypothetical protein